MSPTESSPPTATEDSGDSSTTATIHCTETDPHPVGQSIADTYGTSYEEVMTFFCTGVPFEDIVLAYQTAELANIPVEDVLTLWYDFGDWEEVWAELDLE